MGRTFEFENLRELLQLLPSFKFWRALAMGSTATRQRWARVATVKEKESVVRLLLVFTLLPFAAHTLLE